MGRDGVAGAWPAGDGVVQCSLPKTQSRPWRAAGVYGGIVLVSLLAGSITAELYLAHRSAPRMALPFYNRLYPYVMFHPYESYIWETRETADMSHRKNRIFQMRSEEHTSELQSPCNIVCRLL